MSTVGILGLGLIGGSFAKAYHAAGWTVLAADRDAAILSFAQMSGAVDGTLGAENAAQCDLILACICTVVPSKNLISRRAFSCRSSPMSMYSPVVMYCVCNSA